MLARFAVRSSPALYRDLKKYDFVYFVKTGLLTYFILTL